MHYSKKSMGPVVATGLFITVVIVATISFQVWFQDYSSQVFSDIEESDSSFDFTIETLNNGNLYLRSSSNIEVKNIKLGEENCDIEKDLEKGLNSINLKNCIGEGITTGPEEVYVETRDEVFSTTIYVDEEGTPPIIDRLYHTFSEDIEFPLKINISGEVKSTTETECKLLLRKSKKNIDCKFEENLKYNKTDFNERIFYEAEALNEYGLSTSKQNFLGKGRIVNKTNDWEESRDSNYMNSFYDELMIREVHYLDFDGENDEVEIDKPYKNTDNSGTISAKVFIRDNDRQNSIFSHHTNDDRAYIYARSDRDENDWQWGLGEEWIYSNHSFPVEEWVHITLTWKEGDYKAYQNGNLIDEGSYEGEARTGNGNWYIGSNGEKRNLPGKVKNVKLFNKSVDSSEVDNLYDEQIKNDFYEENEIIGNWELNEGRGNIIYDYSGNSNQGFIKGADWNKLNEDKFSISDSINMKEFEKLHKVLVNLTDEKIKAFKEPGEYTWEVPEGVDKVDVLVVGGGGGGGSRTGGGGGAGGLTYMENKSVSSEDNIEINVGDGGSGGSNDGSGSNGEDSSFGELVALGGGGGFGGGGTGEGRSGGSGGGAGGSTCCGFEEGGSALQPGTNPQADIDIGHDGGYSDDWEGGDSPGGGGGGAGSEGGDGNPYGEGSGIFQSGSGGSGMYFGEKFGNIFGWSGWFAGGGGGNHQSDGDDGKKHGTGTDGGGNPGEERTNYPGKGGLDTSGSGGGGAGRESVAGDGGSGIVLIRFDSNKGIGSELINFDYMFKQEESRPSYSNENWKRVEEESEISQIKDEVEEKDKYFYTKIEMKSIDNRYPVLKEKSTILLNELE